MNIFKSKNKNIVCFQNEELKSIFEVAKKIELLDEIKKQGISLEELKNNQAKMGAWQA